MRKQQVQSAADALSYLTDCTLATVCDLAMKKSRSNSEFKRQMSIAQCGINWMKDFGVPLDSRAVDVDAIGSVEEWAAQYDVRRTPSTKEQA